VNPLYEALPVFAQNVACSAAGWLRERQRFSRHFWRTLEAWERSGAACDGELRATQALRLASLIDYARTWVPHYAGIPPMQRRRDPAEAIRATLAQLPVLEKSAYRDAPEQFLSREHPRHRWARGQTSGTTGTALRLWYTPDALAEEYASVWRMRRHFGVSPADPHMTFGGRMVVPFRQTEPPFWRRDASLNQTLFSLYHMSARNLPAYVDAVHEVKAVYAQGYPSSLHLIARALLEAGRPLPKGKLAAVFTSSETVLATQRAAIEEAFGAPLRDRYGASEFAVSMTGCAAGNLHVDMEYCLVEVEPQERGSGWVRGPLLVTGFANRATPFIRYRIGDIGTRLESLCACGRAGDVFESIDGRIEDYVVTPDGRTLGRLDHVFKTLTDIAEAQIVQVALDQLVVYVVPQPSFTDASERALVRELRARVGGAMAIETLRVAEIARQPNGKLRAVKSLLAPPLRSAA
jgi:phenylacetate-CoA ligase